MSIARPVREPVLIYDRGCRFCQACRTWLEPRVRVTFVAAQDWPEGKSGITASDLASSVYAVDNDRVRQGSAAIALVLSTARRRRWRLVGHILVLPGLSSVAQSAYAVVARHRGQLSLFVRWYRHEWYHHEVG